MNNGVYAKPGWTTLKSLEQTRNIQIDALRVRRIELRQYSDELRMATHKTLTSPTAFGISFAGGVGAGLLAKQQSRKTEDHEKRPMLNNKLLRTLLRAGGLRLGAQLFNL